MNDISEHCLCDHCSGQDCQVFTEEEQEQNQKQHDAAIARAATLAENKRVLDEIERVINEKWFGVDVQDPDGDCCVVATDTLEPLIQSLRTAAQEHP
jgi:hypothetical protein